MGGRWEAKNSQHKELDAAEVLLHCLGITHRWMGRRGFQNKIKVEFMSSSWEKHTLPLSSSLSCTGLHYQKELSVFEMLVRLSIWILSGEDKQQRQIFSELQMCNVFVTNHSSYPKLWFITFYGKLKNETYLREIDLKEVFFPCKLGQLLSLNALR